MKILKKSISIILSAAIFIGAGFAAGYFYASKAAEAEIVEQTGKDLKLPFITERRTVTKEEIKSELIAIKEISSYESKYDVVKAVDEARYILDFAVPGTKNTIEIKCSGIVKVGYNFDDIKIKVDNESYNIYIALPEPKINDNYIIMDTVQCTENNSILNPINFEQYKVLLTELEDMGLKDAESKGIYKDAENNMRKLIENTLSKFDGFEIIFM